MNRFLAERVEAIAPPEETFLDGICFSVCESLPVLMPLGKKCPEPLVSRKISQPWLEGMLTRFFNGLRMIAGAVTRFSSSRIDEERLTSRDPYLEVYLINRIF